eukprot:Opistho-1_new@2299
MRALSPDSPLLSGQVTGDAESLLDFWSSTYGAATLKMGWHEPTDAEWDAAVALAEAFGAPALALLRSLPTADVPTESSAVVAARAAIRRALVVARAVASSLLAFVPDREEAHHGVSHAGGEDEEEEEEAGEMGALRARRLKTRRAPPAHIY